MISGNGQAYTLVTYVVPEDFRTLRPANVQLQILASCMQDSPILLKASNFNLPSANTNAFKVGLEIERKIRQLAWPEICASIFHEVCPGYSNKLMVATSLTGNVGPSYPHNFVKRQEREEKETEDTWPKGLLFA